MKLNTATNILVTFFAGTVNTINLRNTATLSTLYVHEHIAVISCIFKLIMLLTL
jgi:hypothetical protein